MRTQLLAVLLVASLPACAQHAKFRLPPQSLSTQTQTGPRFPNALILAQSEGTEELDLSSGVQAAPVPERPKNLPSQPLTREMLFRFLHAEIAAQRGNLMLAARTYIELARTTRDPRVARRATELAMTGRFSDLSAEASSTWLEIEPDSQPAKQTLIALLVGNSRIADAKPHLQKLLASDKSRTAATFLQLHPLLSRYPDKDAALQFVRDLAQPYPDLPEAHYAVAQAAIAANRLDDARTATDQALALRPSFEAAAVFKSQFLQRESIAGAIGYLEEFLAANPKARDARLMYARMLAAAKRPADARREFETVERDMPQNAEVAVMIGLLALQLQDLDAAETRLKRALDLQYRDPDTLRFYLGQIAEERHRDADALVWYAQVQAGDQVVTAAVRYSMILARQGKVDDARNYLRNVQTQNPQQQILLVQAEAQVLREAKRYTEAFDLLTAELEAHPAQPELLYDLAMIAERLDRLDVLETRLKQLIAIKPDHAQAYNALGYTLADRNLRLGEAREYIQKALSMSPDDAFILDSMGWVEFRLGNLDGAHEHLSRAYSIRQDPEIAAHLGEVLWERGDRAGAERIWAESRTKHPANAELEAVIAKFLK
jgi:tetratricopeptide (TPR) repeat protein